MEAMLPLFRSYLHISFLTIRAWRLLSLLATFAITLEWKQCFRSQSNPCILLFLACLSPLSRAEVSYETQSVVVMHTVTCWTSRKWPPAHRRSTRCVLTGFHFSTSLAAAVPAGLAASGRLPLVLGSELQGFVAWPCIAILVEKAGSLFALASTHYT